MRASRTTNQVKQRRPGEADIQQVRRFCIKMCVCVCVVVVVVVVVGGGWWEFFFIMWNSRFFLVNVQDHSTPPDRMADLLGKIWDLRGHLHI